MPFLFMRCEEKRRARARFSGDTVTYADALTLVETQAASGAWTYPLLVDLTHAATGITPAEIHQLARRVEALSRHERRGPVCIVAPQPVAFGMSRMYQTLTDGVMTLAVVHDEHEAEAWLGAQAIP